MTATVAHVDVAGGPGTLVGIDQPVPLLDGRFVPYVNLDNAASTPAFGSVVDAIDQVPLPFYSGVHRGTGYKSRLSTATFERARGLVGEFLGADPERDVVVFTKNTTEAINKLARALPVETDSVVLTSMLEHHSNDLPWRAPAHGARRRLSGRHAGCRRFRSSPHRVLRSHRPVRCLRRIQRHRSGAARTSVGRGLPCPGGRILVDAAQLAAHRPIDMRATTIPVTSTSSPSATRCTPLWRWGVLAGRACSA
jgi:hypothetical protein